MVHKPYKAVSLFPLLVLLSNNEFATADCADSNLQNRAPSQGDCITSWTTKGQDHNYPKDFDGILNDVTIYECPVSEKRIVVSNGIPDHDVYQVRAAPCVYNWAISMPLDPIKSESKLPIPQKGAIGIATNGVPAYGAMESNDKNAVEPDTGEIQDAQYWYGHATQKSVWHFHNPYMGQGEADSTTLLGWAFDGFPIMGPYAPGAEEVEELDVCNGREVNGKYQYHVKHKDDLDKSMSSKTYCEGNSPENNWNYILGCYHGTIDLTEVMDSTDSGFSIPSDCTTGTGAPTPTTGTSAPSTAPILPPPTVTGKRPNIIVMQPDDMDFFEPWTPPPNNPDRPKKGIFNFPENNGMPNMERLREDGVQMMEAYTASPSCGTSRFSTITGKYPSRAASARAKDVEGIASVTIPMTKLMDEDCSENNVAVALKDAGYRTGMVGKWHLSRISSKEYNYRDAVNTVKGCGFDFVDALYIENMDSEQGDTYSDGTFSHNMEFVTFEAINFITNNYKDADADDDEPEKPFFLYFNPTVPHSSQSIKEALTEFTCKATPRKDEPITSDLMIEGMTAEWGSCKKYRDNIFDRATNEDELGSIWLDDSVGALLTALEKAQILQDTLFLFQTDHGVETKQALYENGNRIVQFVHYPAVIDAGSYDVPVSTVDIAATLLDFAEVDPLPYGMDGISWKNKVVNTSSQHRNDYSRCLFFEMDKDRAVRCGCEKYLTIYAQDAADSNTFNVGKKRNLNYEAENLFDLCGGTNEYITDPTDNQEELGKNLIQSSQNYEKLKEIMTCHLDRTYHTAEVDDYRSCEINPTTSPPTSAPIPKATDSPVKPTKAPTTGKVCIDDPEFKFQDKAIKTCEWVAANENIDALCQKGIIKNSCLIACGRCCEDDPAGFKKGNNMINCLPFLGTEKKKKKQCTIAAVNTPCARTCGRCCYSNKKFKFLVNNKKKGCFFINTAKKIKKFCKGDILMQCQKECGCTDYTK